MATCEKEYSLKICRLIEPIFYWTLDSTLVDSVEGIPLVADITNFGTGIIGDGFRFIPSLNALVKLQTVDPIISYSAGDSLSCTFWMKWSAGFDANDQMIVRFHDNTGDDKVDLLVRWVHVFGVLHITIETENGTDIDSDTAPFTLVLGNWYFFSLVYDYSTGIAKLYINSVLTLETTIPVLFLSSPTDNRILSWQTGSAGGTTLDYIFDEFGWYDEALSEDDIECLYNSGSGSRPSI